MAAALLTAGIARNAVQLAQNAGGWVWRVTGRIAGPHSLRTRMMLLVLLSFLPSLGLSGAFVVVATRRFVEMQDARATDMVLDLRSGVDRSLWAAFRFASTIAQAHAARSANPADEPGRVAAEIGELRGVAEGLGLVMVLRDAEGGILPGFAGAGVAVLPDDIVAALHGPVAPMATDAVPDPLTGRPVAHAVMHLAAGGILDIAMQPSRLSPLLTVGNLVQPARTVLADSTGLILASGDADLVGQRLPAAFMRAVGPEGGGTMLAEWPAGARYHVAYDRVQNAPGWTVSIWDPGWFQAAIWHWPALVWFGFVALSLVISIVAAAMLAQRLVRPLGALTRHARATAAGGDSPVLPVPMSSVREFEALRTWLARAAVVLRHRTATERRALREARDGELLLASVINASADGITVTDLDGNTLLTNAAGVAILGLDTAPGGLGAVSKRRLKQLDLEVRECGQTRSSEIAVMDAERPARLVWMVKSPWRDAGGKVCGVVTVTRDVTAQRGDEARLHALQADQADAALLSAMGVMAAGLAHDLGQPLAAASNFLGAAAQLLDRGSGVPADAQAKDLRTARAREAVGEGIAQVLRAGEIVRSLRAFLAKGRVSPVSIAVAELLADASAVARADGSLGSVRLECAAAPAGLRVQADAAQLRQVLLNLIRNAAEAVQDTAGGVGLIRVAAARGEAGGVVISVCDSGPGIPRDVAGRLFEPFFSTKRLGLGIGLAVCRTIVEAHGGELTAGRAPDDLGGAMFAIALPGLHEGGAA